MSSETNLPGETESPFLRKRATSPSRVRSDWKTLRIIMPAAAAMRIRVVSVTLIVFVIYGCATTAPPPVTPEVMHGVASWYGEEFAGRTTANGEIFDPLQLTAAHRSLPFGTIVDVTNDKTHQTVRIRINDRGPYVGKRMIDLSYAAAQEIGLVEPGRGEVSLNIVKMGKGEREPPAPYVVAIDQPKVRMVIAPPQEPPRVAFPLPSETSTAAGDFSVSVSEEHHGVPTRRQVGADGKTIENVPIASGEAPVVPSAPGHPDSANFDKAQRAAATPVIAPSAKHSAGKFVVQVGAFSMEANAKSLQDRLTRIGQQSYVDHEALYRVRLGPFTTRDDAVKARSALESSGLSAIIVIE